MGSGIRKQVTKQVHNQMRTFADQAQMHITKSWFIVFDLYRFFCFSFFFLI